MTQKLRYAIVGAGGIASAMADNMISSDRQIVGVYNHNYDRAAQFSARYGGFKVYNSLDELVCDKAVDAVYIATPHSDHYNTMLKCIEGGKHMLCEKAITLNGNQLEDVLKKAHAKSLCVFEAMTIYHMPLYNELEKIVQSGRLGKVKSIESNYFTLLPKGDNNRFYNPNLAGGALLDIGVYALSFAATFMPLDENKMFSHTTKTHTGMDDSSSIILFSDDCTATVTLSMTTNQPRRGIVICEKGYISVENYSRGDTAEIYYNESGKCEKIKVGDINLALTYELSDFELAVAGSGGNLNTERTKSVMRVMTALRKSWGITFPNEN